ncbi:hypothetical protein [Streptomyces goshikiensis]|uniref:hypothetical protein n=1 Tax=Streptomyces goshikiensis TaxID=1942 RepID=UPI00365A056D
MSGEVAGYPVTGGRLCAGAFQQSQQQGGLQDPAVTRLPYRPVQPDTGQEMIT